MIIKNIILILPFFSFIFGYNLISYFFVTKDIEVPKVIGKSLIEASKILSEHNLNLRILKQKDDSNLPDGTVIDQIPFNKKIKINKPVYLTISKKIKEFKIPDFKLKKLSEIQNILKKNNLKSKVYYLNSKLENGLCIGHIPAIGNQINKSDKIILYISLNNKKAILFPNLKNLNLNEVINFLKLNNLKADIIVNNFMPFDQNKNYNIIDQRPIAGSIVDLAKTSIQLYVQATN